MRILEIMGADPSASQHEIARVLGLSQPAVAARLRRLRRSGLMKTVIGLDIFGAGLHLARVDISTTAPHETLSAFRHCPYFYNGYITSGRENLTLMFVAREISTREIIVDRHIRTMPTVNNLDFSIIITSAKPVVHTLSAHDDGGCPDKDCKECILEDLHRTRELFA